MEQARRLVLQFGAQADQEVPAGYEVQPGAGHSFDEVLHRLRHEAF